jgi:hypothetical protein
MKRKIQIKWKKTIKRVWVYIGIISHSDDTIEDTHIYSKGDNTDIGIVNHEYFEQYTA